MSNKRIGDIVLAHVFLTIDKADTDLSIFEISVIVNYSETTVQRAVPELIRMGCVDSYYVNIGGHMNIKKYSVTGHNCYFCSPDIVPL